MHAQTHRKIAFIGLFAFLLLGAAACNTMEGLGEDIESGGQGLQEEAEQSKQQR